MNERANVAAFYTAHVGAAAACTVRASSCVEALGASGLLDTIAASSAPVPEMRDCAVAIGAHASGTGVPADADRRRAPVPDRAEVHALALVVYAAGSSDSCSERFPAGSLFFVDGLQPAAFEAALVPAGARVLWVAPALSARDLRIADIRVLSAAAHARGALLAVDMSATTSYCSAALELGADLCLERLDADGLCDMFGAAGARSLAADAHPRWVLSVARPRRKKRGGAAAALNRVRLELARAMGGAQDACELRALHDVQDADGAQTLRDRDARTQRRCDHAHALAAYLSCCDAVPAVVYPGLPAHPDHALASQALRHGAGFVLDFEVPVSVRAGAFMARIAPRAAAASAATEPETRTRLLARDGAEGRFVRLIAGLDDPLAIADDLDQALRWFCNPPEP